MLDLEEKILNGKNILVTRPQEQAFEFASKLIAEGANIYLLPTVKITLPEDYTEIDRSLGKINGYDWIVFTSTNAVRYFVERMQHLRLFADVLKAGKIAAVGPATALMLEKEGIHVDYISGTHTGEFLASTMEDVSGKKILVPTTDINRGKLREILSQRGAEVEEVAFYNTRKNEVADDYIIQTFNAGIDMITFTSSSSVEALVELVSPLHIPLEKFSVACIGPHTADTARHHGLKVDVIAKPFTLDGLISELVKYYHTISNANSPGSIGGNKN